MSTPLMLVLPGCPERHPEHLHGLEAVQMQAPKSTPGAASKPAASLAALDQALPRAQRPQVQAVLASSDTPALLCLLVSQAIPQAKKWFYDHASTQWSLLETRGASSPVSTAPARQPIPATLLTATSRAAPEPVEKIQQIQQIERIERIERIEPTNPPSQDLSTMEDGALLFRAFDLKTWERSTEHERQLNAITEEAYRRGPEMVLRFQKSQQCAAKAFELTQPMLANLAKNGQADTEEWIKQHTIQLHKSIKNHLEYKLKKELAYQANRRQRYISSPGAKPVYTSGITPIQLAPGAHHPNSLAHQPIAPRWSVYVDETGSRFGADTDDLAPSDKDLGRLIALAVPERTQLPPLGDFHAADTTAAQVDAAVQTLLQAPVGILGFTVQDRSSTHSEWIGHVQHLVRWVLLQLPVPTATDDSAAQPCTVTFQIEHRGIFTAGTDLGLLTQLLESEMRALDPQRYEKLRLQLAIMDKNHPVNGYVDTVAFTWGSPAKTSKDRLKKSALRGHCLIDAPEQTTQHTHSAWQRNLHHLYLTLSHGHSLDATDWYALCSAASVSPPQGLLVRALHTLGQQCQSSSAATAAQAIAIWGQYLSYVQQRLHTKDYRLTELAQALQWLQQYAPKDCALPPGLQLQLQSASLASANHQGHSNAEQLAQCLDLALQLRDELPTGTTEIVLRLASATTNAFEFDALRDPVQDWLAHSQGLGLALQGKLHSTLGQIHAFTGTSEAAQAAFAAAQQCFARLSASVSSSKRATMLWCSTWTLVAAPRRAAPRSKPIGTHCWSICTPRDSKVSPMPSAAVWLAVVSRVATPTTCGCVP